MIWEEEAKPYRLRSAQGVIELADKHDSSRLEAACAKAIAVGDPSYRTVKGILGVSAERDQLPSPLGDGGAAAILRAPPRMLEQHHGRPVPARQAGPDPPGRFSDGDDAARLRDHSQVT